MMIKQQWLVSVLLLVQTSQSTPAVTQCFRIFSSSGRPWSSWYGVEVEAFFICWGLWACLFCHHQVKKHKKEQTQQKKNTQQILDFLLKFGEQDWFQLLFMCAKYESSSVNRKKSYWSLKSLPVNTFCDFNDFIGKEACTSWSFKHNIFCSTNCIAFKLGTLWNPQCSSIFSKIH